MKGTHRMTNDLTRASAAPALDVFVLAQIEAEPGGESRVPRRCTRWPGPCSGGRIRPQSDRENAFARTSRGGDGPGVQPSLNLYHCFTMFYAGLRSFSPFPRFNPRRQRGLETSGTTMPSDRAVEVKFGRAMESRWAFRLRVRSRKMMMNPRAIKMMPGKSLSEGASAKNIHPDRNDEGIPEY